MTQSIFPDDMIGSTAEADVGHRLSVDADCRQQADQGWRDVLIQQQSHG